jgi:hypothetical protein
MVIDCSNIGFEFRSVPECMLTTFCVVLWRKRPPVTEVIPGSSTTVGEKRKPTGNQWNLPGAWILPNRGEFEVTFELQISWKLYFCLTWRSEKIIESYGLLFPTARPHEGKFSVPLFHTGLNVVAFLLQGGNENNLNFTKVILVHFALMLITIGARIAQWYSSGLRAGCSGVRIPAGSGNFSLHHCVQTGSEAHPASYPMGTRGFFPGVRRPEREADLHLQCWYQECVEIYFRSPNAFMAWYSVKKANSNYNAPKCSYFIAVYLL